MRRKTFIITALVLALVLVLVLFAGCSSNKTGTADKTPASSSVNDNSQTGKEQNQPSSGPEPISLPIVKEPLTLKYFSYLDGKVAATLKSLGDVACYKKMEEITGIHIEWQHPPAGQETEQFNLMIASQELPDMIWWNWPTVAGGPAKAIQDGTIIKLNDWLEKYAPNLTKVFNKYPEARKQAMLDDGTLYEFPMLRLREDRPEWYKTGGFMIRKDWLDRVGLQPPKTIDEWYTVLKTFKDKDANGNGDPNDEIPFGSNKDSGLRNLASAWGVLVDFYQDNGKIKYGPIEPAFKDYLNTLHQWYAEGLIDTEYVATDGKNFDAKVTDNKIGLFQAALSGGMGRYLDLMKGKDPSFDLLALPWPIGPAGKAYTAQSDYNKVVPGDGTAITGKNQHVKESVKWLDYAYSDEGNLLFNFGIEGESYVMENGYPKYTDIVMKNPDGLPMDQAGSRYCMSIANAPMLKDPRAFEQTRLAYPEQKDAQKVWDPADQSLLLPPITPTADESSRLASIMNEINTYVSEMFNKFVMGQEPISNFDKFVQNIKNMGIDEAIKIQQAALDRYNKR